MRDTGITINEQPRVRLQLEVHPPGGAPYQTDTTLLISRLMTSQFMPGAVVPVKYDPQNPRRVVIDPGGSVQDSAAVQAAAGAAMANFGAFGNFGPGLNPQAMTAMLQAAQQASETIRASGTSAQATVVTFTPLGINVNGNNPAASIEVEVTPEAGPKFRATTTGVIGEAAVPKYQPGQQIWVKYDPNDLTKVALDHS
jgi:hypothetical protein